MRERGAVEPALTPKGGRAQALPPSGSDGGGVGAVAAGEGQKEESHHSLRDGEIRYR